MTEHRPNLIGGIVANGHDYIPAAGHDVFLPGYDLLTRLLGMGKYYDKLVAQAGLGDGIKALEIGCGTGNVTARAKRAHPGAVVVGIDPDPRALARAQRKAGGLSGIRYEQGYAQRLPFADGEFDRVLSSMMLHHLDEQVKSGAIAEVFRVLRPGGSMHLLDVGGHMTAADGLGARRALRIAEAQGNLGDAIPRLLREAGFDCTEVATQKHRVIGRLTFYRAVRPPA